jgi:uncharacterized membrane protein YphA (DoxX/SURF4 family)
LSLKSTVQTIKGFLLSEWPQRVVRFIIGAVFIYAGAVKIVDPKAFAKAISQYDLVPEALLAPVAIGLPLLEIVAGIGLVFAVRGSMSIIFGMLGMFVIVLWYGILNNLDIDCGCFTSEELKKQASLWNAFYRDIAMIAGVLYLLVVRWTSSGKGMNYIMKYLPLNKEEVKQ